MAKIDYTLLAMPPRRKPQPRRRRRNAEGRESDSRPWYIALLSGLRDFAGKFLRRRSTKWLAAAIITLAIGISLGRLAGGGDGDDATPTPTPTVEIAGAPPAPPEAYGMGELSWKI